MARFRLLALLVCLSAVSACAPDDIISSEDEDGKTDVETPIPPEPEPEPDPEPDGPALPFESSFEAVASMGVGWNLGNTLEAMGGGDADGRDWKKWETSWGQAVTTPGLMAMMRDAGFGAIRVPVSWGVHMDADKLTECVSVLKSSAVTEYQPFVHRLRLAASP